MTSEIVLFPLVNLCLKGKQQRRFWKQMFPVSPLLEVFIPLLVPDLNLLSPPVCGALRLLAPDLNLLFPPRVLTAGFGTFYLLPCFLVLVP